MLAVQDKNVIPTISDRLSNAVNIQDRRAAIKALKNFANYYREDIILYSLKNILKCFQRDQLDKEITKNVLQCLLVLFIRNETGSNHDLTDWLSNNSRFQNGKYLSPVVVLSQDSLIDQFSYLISDELTQANRNIIELIINLLEFNDFYITLYSLQLLQALVSTRTEKLKEIISTIPVAIPNIVATIDSDYDPIRNEAVLLLMAIVNKNYNLQRVVAFQDIFPKLFLIIDLESSTSLNNIIIQDCLTLIYNLLDSNLVNQKLFLESNHLTNLAQYLETFSSIDSLTNPTSQLLENIITVLKIVSNLFISKQNGTTFLAQVLNSKILINLLKIIFLNYVPNQLKAFALFTLADVIIHNDQLKTQLTTIDVPYLDPCIPNISEENPPLVPVLQLLLNWCLFSNSIHVFDVRLGAFQVIKAYITDNELLKESFLVHQVETFHKLSSTDHHTEPSIIDSLVKQKVPVGNVFVVLLEYDPDVKLNPYKVWFASLILTHLVKDNYELKQIINKFAVKNFDNDELFDEFFNTQEIKEPLQNENKSSDSNASSPVVVKPDSDSETGSKHDVATGYVAVKEFEEVSKKEIDEELEKNSENIANKLDQASQQSDTNSTMLDTFEKSAGASKKSEEIDSNDKSEVLGDTVVGESLKSNIVKDAIETNNATKLNTGESNIDESNIEESNIEESNIEESNTIKSNTDKSSDSESSESSTSHHTLTAIESMFDLLINSLMLEDKRIAISYLMFFTIYFFENVSLIKSFMRNDVAKRTDYVKKLVYYIKQENNGNVIIIGMIFTLIGIIYDSCPKDLFGDGKTNARLEFYDFFIKTIGIDNYKISCATFKKNETFNKYEEFDIFEMESFEEIEKDQTGLPKIYFHTIYVTLIRENFERIVHAFENDPNAEPNGRLNFGDFLTMSKEYEHVREELDNKLQEKTSLETKIAQVETQLQSVEKSYKEIQASFDHLENENKSLISKNQAYSTKITTLNGLITKLNTKISTLETQLYDLNKRIRSLESEKSQLEQERKTLTASKKKSEDGINKMSRELFQFTKKDQENAVQINDLNKKVSTLQTEKKNHLQQLENLQLEKQKLQKEFADYERSLINDLNSMSFKLNQTMSEKDQLRNQLEEVTRLKDQQVLSLENKNVEQAAKLENQLSEWKSKVDMINKGHLEVVEKLETKIKTHVAKEVELQREVMKLNENLKQSNSTLETIKNEKETILKELSEKSLQIESLETFTKTNKDKIQTLEKQIADLNHTIMTREKDVANISEELETIKKSLTSKDLDIGSLNNKLEQDKKEIDKLKQQIEKLQDEIKNYNQKNAELEKLLKDKTSEIDTLTKASERDLKVEQKKSKETVDKLQHELERKVADYESNLNEKDEKVSTLEFELNNKNSIIEDLETSLSDKNKELEKSTENGLMDVGQKEKEMKERLNREKEMIKEKLNKEKEARQNAIKEKIAKEKELNKKLEEIQRLQLLLELLKKKNEALEHEFSKEKDTLNGEKETLIKERNELIEEKKSLVSEKDALLGEKDSLTKEINSLLSDKDKSFSQFEKEQAKLKTNVETLEEQLDVKNKSLEKEKQKAEDLLENKEKQIIKLTKDLESESDKLKSLKSDYSSLDEEFKHKIAELETKSSKTIQSNNDKLKNQVGELEKQLNEKDSKLAKLEAELITQKTEAEESAKLKFEDVDKKKDAKIQELEKKLAEMVEKADFDDLVLLMMELDEKTKKYKKQLKDLNQEVSDEEKESDESDMSDESDDDEE